MGNFERDFSAAVHSEAPGSLSPELRHYWDLPVSELATLREPLPGPEERERHRIFALMLMALVHHYWNGNKRGRRGTYPWNESNSSGPYLGDDYQGHNIAAIAVNRDGVILDFDFNHNRLFNSSTEHAEARLVRRLFSLSQLSDTWRPSLDQHVPRNDYNMLADVTVYTSLESCAQCAGIMSLGRIKQVVYLQTDPGMYFIGRILRNLTDQTLRAPLPIAAGEINIPYFGRLDAAADNFASRVATEPFWVDGDAKDVSDSVTSFLCTKMARDIFAEGAAEFRELVANPTVQLNYSDHRPQNPDGTTNPLAKSNVDVVGEASDFLAYATISGRRGTPHR